VRAALTERISLRGSDAGGERAAIAYTILACCRLADVNPVEYLRTCCHDSPVASPEDLPDLLPARWKAAAKPLLPRRPSRRRLPARSCRRCR